MNIAIVGYGQMGKEIERVSKKRGHNITLIVDNTEELKKADLTGIDTAIEFSLPETAIENIKILAKNKINTVVGTTGWYDKLPQVKRIVDKNNISFLWSSNFSIGVNLFFRLTEQAAKLINKADEYDIWATEIHHKFKADSPSGTAKTLEQILVKNINRKTKIIEDKLDRPIKNNEIHFSSTRGGEINFGHTIGFDSTTDCIKIEHAARNRDGYVLGAVKCAEWLTKQKPGFYEMNDFMEGIL